MIPNQFSYYGGFRTRTFADIFPNFQEFYDNYTKLVDDVGFPNKFSGGSTTLRTIYYLLYGRYGNSHIAYSDENQWRFALASTLFMYGPSWEKRLEIQDKLRGLTEQELITGSKAIYNHSYNPSTEPSTGTLEELPTINEQNTTNYKKTKMEAYGLLMALIKTDVTEEFIGMFRKLFLTIVAPDFPLLYVTEETENE